MATSDEQRRERAEQRRRRREGQTAGNGDRADAQREDASEDTGSVGDDALKTGAALAAAGALVGAAVGAATAIRERRESGGEPAPDEGADEVAAEEEHPPEAAHDAEPEAEAETEPEDGDEVEPEPEDQADAEPEAEQEGEPEPGSAAAIVSSAAEQLSQLTGRETEGVLGFERTENGWLVQVETVELRRIPPTTDVLGVYDVELDDDGNLRHYRRSGRYVRSQAGGGEE